MQLSNPANIQLPKPTKNTNYLSKEVYDEILNGVGVTTPLVIENYVSEDICQEIISFFNTQIAERRTYQGQINLEYRDSEFVRLPEKYFTIFLKFIKEKMAGHFKKNVDSLELIKPVIYRYGVGVGFKPHHDMVTDIEIERCKKNNLPIIGGDYTIILMINNLFAEQGGQFKLVDHNIEVTQKAGTIVSFRVDAVHEVLPILEGERYSVVCRYQCKAA